LTLTQSNLVNFSLVIFYNIIPPIS